MIDHASLSVRALAPAAAFYEAALKPLGYAKLVERPGTVGFGKRYPELWLNLRDRPAAADDASPRDTNPGDPGAHLALRARDEAAVRAFHAAALKAGGRDAGAPGPRQGAMTAYYGAFVLDPDGNKLEALTFPAG